MKKFIAGICFFGLFILFVYAQNAFRVNQDGNVGIGIENAAEKLEVDGNIKAHGRMEDKTGIVMPVGTILSFAGPLDNVPAGWLACDGQSYPIDLNNEYWDLYGTIGISWGGDSANFNVPDLRGLFLRGTDDMGTDMGTAGRDPDASLREELNPDGNNGNNVGSMQADQFKSHSHSIRYHRYIDDRNHSDAMLGSGDNHNHVYYQNSYSTGGSETRPINVYVNYIIKY